MRKKKIEGKKKREGCVCVCVCVYKWGTSGGDNEEVKGNKIREGSNSDWENRDRDIEREIERIG